MCLLGTEAVVATATGEGALTERLATLRRLRGPALDGFGAGVRELVLVASSSRGGSSMLTETLRASRALIHLNAEINPFLRLAGLGYPESGSDSDRLDAAHLRGLDPERRRALEEDLALDAGQPADTLRDEEQFGLDVAWRIAVQWPELTIDPKDTAVTARAVLTRLRAERGWAPGEVRDVRLFQLCLLHELRAGGLPVDARYYDLPRALLRGEPPVAGTPGDTLIEEPPFVLPRVWRRATAADLETRPLVIKTPSNAYRLEFLRALFPNARIRILHLTRNPAASINGLYDGWGFDGFHAHRMDKPLEIEGYADDRWWKFDLPPGWRDFTGSPLPQVCGFQWWSCHRAILDDLEGGGVDHIRIRFEDLITGVERRMACYARLSDWLGIPLDGEFRRAARDGIDPVAATEPPRPYRWLARQEMIRTAVRGRVRAVAEELGYGIEKSWI